MAQKRIEESTGRPIDAVHHDETALVENMYREDAGITGALDSTSHHNMEQHLHDRHQPEEVEETEKDPIFFRHTTIIDRPSWRNGHWGDWLVSPKAAAILTLSGLVLVNTIANADNLKTLADDIGDEVAIIWHDMQEGLDPLPNLVVEKAQPTTEESTIRLTASTYSEQDRVHVDPADITTFVSEIDSSQEHGGTITDIRITGGASDETGSQTSIGQIDQYNADLAAKRAEAAKAELVRQASEQGISLPDIDIAIYENVLSAEAKAHLDSLAQAAGYSSGWEAVQLQASGRQIDGELGQLIETEFTAARNYILTADIVTPGDPNIIRYEVPQSRPTPENPVRDYDWRLIAIPVLPFRRFHRGIVSVAEPTISEYQPGPLRTTTLKVYPEGVESTTDFRGVERHYLVGDEPWQWVRKYQHLLRDDRIQHFMRAEYTDANGKERSLRVLFADHIPSTDSIAMFQRLLESASLVQDGSLPDNHSVIVVFPRENTGKSPEDPKRIGLGIDTQDDPNILGFNMPMLKLIELHMDDTDLEDAAHILTHELHGHGSDIRRKRIQLNPIEGGNTEFGRYVAEDTWRRVGGPIVRSLQSLNDPQRSLMFEAEDGIRYPESHTRKLSREAAAGNVRLTNGRPTRYGDNALEGYAEAAWSLATDTPIPFSEAGINSTGGYRLPRELEQVVQRNVGANDTPYVLGFDREPNVVFTQGTVAEDSLLNTISNQAKARPVPTPDNMAEIVTSISD